MYNWIIFVCVILIVYCSNYFLKKIFLKASGPVVVDKELEDLSSVVYKTLEQQKQYLNLLDKQKNIYGDPFKKFLFIILMFIAFSVMLGYVPLFYMPIFGICYTMLVPLLYVWVDRNEFKTYNYLSMSVTFIFFTSFLVIQAIDPLYFFGFKITLIYLVILYFAINAIIKYIKEKLFKRRNMRY